MRSLRIAFTLVKVFNLWKTLDRSKNRDRVDIVDMQHGMHKPFTATFAKHILCVVLRDTRVALQRA